MKIDIRNLGVIENAEINLRPMTIFVGPNNSGKTWLAYAIAAILGPHGWSQYKTTRSMKEIKEIYPPLKLAFERVLDEGSASIDLVDFAEHFGETYFNDVSSLAPLWMQEFMGTRRSTFENLEMQVTIGEDEKYYLDQIRHYSLNRGLSKGKRRKKGLLHALKESGNSTLYFYTEENITDKLPLQVIEDFLIGRVFEILHRSLYPNTYILPTERTTFISIPFNVISQDQADEAPTKRETSQQEQKVRHGAQPLASLLNLIVEALESDPAAREKKARSNPEISHYRELAQILEKEILAGGVDFSTPEPESSREVLFQPNQDVSLEMPIVSSMVKELSPLVLYLRCLAEPGDWLIIDEPEMNLHPLAQVRLIEFLAMLVNAGLHILITTHSSYMVDHLVNLMKAYDYENKEKIQRKFYLARTEAFISKKHVSVYLFDKKTTRSILDEDGIINWKTFSGVSDQINQIYFELEESY